MPIYSSTLNRNTTRAVLSGAMILSLFTTIARGQSESSVEGARGGIPAGFELDNYVRYLQTMGRVPLGAWGLRPFSVPEVDSLTKPNGPHPWANSWMFRAGEPRHFAVLPVTVTAGYNSAFPWGSNEGAVWAGRGPTTSLQGGIAAAWGPVTLVLNPIVFRAENQSFQLQPNGNSGNGIYANGDFPNNVDLPQRFGNRPYSRFDWGQSTLRFDGFGLSAGVSTANQYWGPAATFPVILGNNAAGIPHAFIGTERPTNIAIGRFEARVVYGLEGQSAFSPVTGPDTFTSVAQPGTRRFMSGLVVTFAPAPIRGLELGVARFFHEAWTGHLGTAELRSPFEGLLKNSLAAGTSVAGEGNQDALKNQLASLFGRWVLPHSGFEIYAEYGHEDHNADSRDLISEPDHSRLAMAGFRKVFLEQGERFQALRAEYIDATEPTLARNRGEGGIYIHGLLLQGHTQYGQLLGADIGVGSAAGANLAWDAYDSSGRTTIFLQREVQNHQAPLLSTDAASLQAQYLSATIGYERHRFTRRVDVAYGFALTDAKRGPETPRSFNVHASLSVTAPFGGVP